MIPMDYQKAKRSLHDARAERADGVSSCNSFEYSLKKRTCFLLYKEGRRNTSKETCTISVQGARLNGLAKQESWNNQKQTFQFESLILAQDERWRRA